MRTCRKCRGIKPPEAFYPNRSRPNGLQFYCRACKRDYQRTWIKDVRRMNGAGTVAEWKARGQRTQTRVLAAVRAVWARDGRPPTLADLAREAGLAGTAQVLPHLARLEADGRVERDPVRRTVWPAGLRDRIRALLVTS